MVTPGARPALGDDRDALGEPGERREHGEVRARTRLPCRARHRARRRGTRATGPTESVRHGPQLATGDTGVRGRERAGADRAAPRRHGGDEDGGDGEEAGVGDDATRQGGGEVVQRLGLVGDGAGLGGRRRLAPRAGALGGDGVLDVVDRGPSGDRGGDEERAEVVTAQSLGPASAPAGASVANGWSRAVTSVSSRQACRGRLATSRVSEATMADSAIQSARKGAANGEHRAKRDLAGGPAAAALELARAGRAGSAPSRPAEASRTTAPGRR